MYKLFLITGQRERKKKKDGWVEDLFLESTQFTRRNVERGEVRRVGEMLGVINGLLGGRSYEEGEHVLLLCGLGTDGHEGGVWGVGGALRLFQPYALRLFLFT